MNILGRYKITYANGFVQYKNLISHEEYLSVIKTSESKIYDLEKANKWKPPVQSNQLRKLVKSYGSYFTDKSPLYDAYLTGYIELSIGKGFKQPCKVETI